MYNTNRNKLSPRFQSQVFGGNTTNAWLGEALKLLIAYWGSIKTGFSDGYHDYFENKK